MKLYVNSTTKLMKRYAAQVSAPCNTERKKKRVNNHLLEMCLLRDTFARISVLHNLLRPNFKFQFTQAFTRIRLRPIF